MSADSPRAFPGMRPESQESVDQRSAKLREAWPDAPTSSVTAKPEMVWDEGMSLRDYFAAKAMAAMLIPLIEQLPEDAARELIEYCVSERAYQLADAMLAAREA